MAITAHAYGALSTHLTQARIDFDSDTFKVSLHTSTYSPDQDADDFFNDATNEVSNGSGYTTGGETLAGLSVGYTAGTNTFKWDANDTPWTALTKTFRYAVVRKARGGAASADELVMWVDFGADQSPAGVDFTIQWAAAGLLTIVTTA